MICHGSQALCSSLSKSCDQGGQSYKLGGGEKACTSNRLDHRVYTNYCIAHVSWMIIVSSHGTWVISSLTHRVQLPIGHAKESMNEQWKKMSIYIFLKRVSHIDNFIMMFIYWFHIIKFMIMMCCTAQNTMSFSGKIILGLLISWKQTINNIIFTDTHHRPYVWRLQIDVICKEEQTEDGRRSGGV